MTSFVCLFICFDAKLPLRGLLLHILPFFYQILSSGFLQYLAITLQTNVSSFPPILFTWENCYKTGLFLKPCVLMLRDLT